MKAFRGSLVALVLFGVVFALVRWLQPAVLAPEIQEGDAIFSFEKHELSRVEVVRPDAEPIVLVEVEILFISWCWEINS